MANPHSTRLQAAIDHLTGELVQTRKSLSRLRNAIVRLDKDHAVTADRVSLLQRVVYGVIAAAALQILTLLLTLTL